MEGDTWTSARGGDHPLSRLEGRPLAHETLVVMLGPQNRSGARYFQMVLRDGTGGETEPLLLALHHSGPYPSYNWIEVIGLKRALSLPGRDVTLSEEDIERLFGYLSELIPPGGHMMVEYESGGWDETRLSIGCGIPPVVTPLGGMLFRAGCGVSFKDWHFAEGGQRGPQEASGI